MALPDPLATKLKNLEDAFSGVVGLWAYDLRHRQTFQLRSDEPFPAASTIKLFVLRELFRQLESGEVHFTEEVVVRSQDMVPGSGILKDLAPGLRLRLSDAATLMVTVSDNVAANLLIDRLRTTAINRGAREAGFTSTWLSGKLFRKRASLSTTTPRDLGSLMLEIARGKAISRRASRAMLEILRREQSDHIVGRFLPHGATDSRGPIAQRKVASKNGSLPGVRHDIAYVDGSDACYVIALMSRGCTDTRFSVDNEATLCLARIARAVHDQVSSG